MAITLGLVEAIDSNGVYVSMPGSRGVVRGPFATLQNVAANDRVLVVTTDDGENVIVGLASAAAPRSTPATSTDNAVARFDGTGGALQESALSIDDSGNTTLTATGSVYHYINSVAGSHRGLRIRSAGSDRWIIRVNATAESGTNAGSNFELLPFSDAGSSLGSFLIIYRATGRMMLANVGATGGLEMGSGGPTITTGTGAPSHSAPNGSLYLRTDGTASTTLYVRAAGAWSALS